LAGLTFTGFIMKYMPHGGGYGRGFRGGCGPGQTREFWLMSRHEWGDIHFYLAVLFVILMVVHIALHWSWIKSYFKLRFGFSLKKTTTLIRKK
jgi:hypothetical protein